jgi:multidrug efflux system membrane fusion protein
MNRAATLVMVGLLAGGSYAAWLWAGKPDVPALVTGRAAPSQPAAASRGSAGPAVAVVTATAEAVDFPVRRRSIGNIEAMATVTVRSRVDSQLLTQEVNDGQFVRKGDLLFTLDDKELRAVLARDEANLARDQANLTRTQADLQRKRELLSSGSGAQQQVDQALSDAKAAEAAVAADEATLDTNRLRLSYTRIEAPIDGRLGSIQVTPGNLVRAADSGGSGLVTITQIKPIRVSFTLPERELAAVRAATTNTSAPAVRVFPSGSRTAAATGPLSFIDSAVDLASGTITAKAVFANEDLTLWPGQYVDVEIQLGSRPNTIVVPTVAVQAGQASPYVFVARPDGTAELRPVKVVSTDGERTALAEGLAAGERVVVDGQLRLANGTRIRDATPAASRTGGVPLSAEEAPGKLPARS